MYTNAYVKSAPELLIYMDTCMEHEDFILR